MLATAAALGLFGLIAASPIAERATVPNYPEKSVSKGFRLVVNVTDTVKDFHPSIQHSYISGIHVGAGLALVGQVSTPDIARVFYGNGTLEEERYGKSNVLSDSGSGTSTFPSGIQLTKDEGSQVVSSATLNGGPGSPGIGITHFPEPYAYIYPDTWVACNESLAYYRGAYYITFKQADITVGKDGSVNRNVPDGCAPVRLIPECAQLEDVPPNAIASHQYALDSQCYKDVTSIDWSKYGP